ncbi:TPA: transposase [Escherichia coli]|uniref:IS110 family transposase n=1 Tax=Escherichia sp. MOD1-EC5110 TaxID=2093863 RepID=UPI00235161E0|nr:MULTISPECIES: transposase [Escherichia]
MTESSHYESAQVFIGIDAGKDTHHAVAVNRSGNRFFDKALPIAVARSEGVLVGYLPGLAMRRIADLLASEAKTDAHDAAIIAEATRTLPYAPRSLKLADEQIVRVGSLTAAACHGLKLPL